MKKQIPYIRLALVPFLTDIHALYSILNAIVRRLITVAKV